MNDAAIMFSHLDGSLLRKTRVPSQRVHVIAMTPYVWTSPTGHTYTDPLEPVLDTPDRSPPDAPVEDDMAIPIIVKTAGNRIMAGTFRRGAALVAGNLLVPSRFFYGAEEQRRGGGGLGSGRGRGGGAGELLVISY